MSIPEWLVERANDGIFPLNVAELSSEISEVLQMFGQDADSIIEDSIRSHCCDLLRSRQRDIEYLSCLALHKVIAKHIRSTCRKAEVVQTIESWLNLDPFTAKMDDLADEIANEIRTAWIVRTPPGANEPKFSKELVLDSIDKYHHGLENLIGYPPTHANFLELMKQEHVQAPFAGRDRTVDPQVEWNIVMGRGEWIIVGAGCEPTFNSTKRHCTQALEYYVCRAREKFAEVGAIDDVLNEAEVAALRLWTGPMYEKYAEVLRNPQKNPSCPYVTTLHAINSGITKLARIWPLPVSRKVYRGYKNLRLQNFKKDAFNSVGGVEKCVLATSEDLNVAVDYSEDGAFILEIEVGQANRGADVSWLSQYPHEREILFNAFSNVEFVCSPQQRIVHFKGTGPGRVLVYPVCVSANLKSKTLDEFVRLRRDLHLNLVDVLAQEALRTISVHETKSSHGLIKRLCAECTKQCNFIIDEARNSDVSIFNEGTQTYVSLVKDAIMFKSRSETIIKLALWWIENRMADPAALEELVHWQLEALRVAIYCSEPPEVTTLVLEQDREVPSLFGATTLHFGDIHKVDTVYSLAKLLRLNPVLEDLSVRVDSTVSATAELWEKVFNELCPGRPNLLINGFHLAGYAISSLRQLELQNLDNEWATMIAPALLLHTPRALTSLNLQGSPIACTGAESLGRAFTGLQKLKYVDLSFCQVGDRGCTGIAQALLELSELEELRIVSNNVNNDGFNILASKIHAFGLARLKLVDLRGNITKLPTSRCGVQCIMKNDFGALCSKGEKPPCVAWSPGGDHIASMSDSLLTGDRTIIIWDLTTGNQTLTLKGRTCVAWRPEGDQLASASLDKAIIIWDAKTGEQVSTLKGHRDEVTSVAWRPGGDQIVSGGGKPSWAGGGDGEVIVWNAKTCDVVNNLKGHSAMVTSVAWRPGFDQVASASWDKTLIIWDVKTGEQVLMLKGHTAAVSSVAWHPRGDQIASASQDNSIIIWDSQTGDQTLTLKKYNGLSNIAWRPVGDQIASGSFPHQTSIWDVKTGKQVLTFDGHATVVSVAWSPRGDQIVAGAFGWGNGRSVEVQDEPREIIIWDVETEDQISLLKGHTSAVEIIVWSVRGDQLASASYNGTIIIWDAKTGEQVSTIEGHSEACTSLAFSPGADQIASSSRDKSIIIWDVKTGNQVLMLKGHAAHVTSVAWRPRGGDQIVSGGCGAGGDVWRSSCDPGEIFIWDTTTGKKVSTLKGHPAKVTSVAWSPGGEQIVSGGYGSGNTNSWGRAERPGKIIVWDAKTGDQVLTLKGHTSAVTSVAWSPSGDQIASGSGDKTIIIWDAKSGFQVLMLKGHSQGITTVAWSSGSNYIASGSDDETIVVWDAKNGDQVSKLKGHEKGITSVAWNPGSDKIASSSPSRDNMIIIWDVKVGDQA